MAAIVHSEKAKKSIKKITETMQDYPLGIEFGELMQRTGYAKASLYNALSLVGASKSDDGLWHLPHSNTSDAPVNEATEDEGGNIQDTPVNMQDEELNTTAPQVSSPDNDEVTLINTPATLVNTSAEVVNPSDIDTDIDQSSDGQAIETAPVSASDDATLIDEGTKSDTRQANLFWSKDKVYCPMFGGEIFELEINTSHTGSAYPNAISGIGFTREGQWNTTGAVMLYHANEENYQLLCQKYPELDFEVPMFAGSYLCIKQLKKGKKFIICAVSDLSDARALERLSDGDNNIKVITGYDKSSRYFIDVNSITHTFAVPLSDDTGQPLSISDAFGAV